MPAHVRTVEVPEGDRRELERRVRDKAAPARVVERARIVLLAADGVPGKRIAAIVGCAEPTVVTWRGRYAERSLAGLEDLPRPGKPSPLPEALRDRVLELTLTEPPTQFGATHWSSRLLAEALAGEGTPISHVTVARIWHRFGVQPWQAQTFKFSTDPQLEAKVRDVVGLYLHPLEKAVVLCMGEKPQIQALERTAPTLPVRPGDPEAATLDYVRHGTTTLFAALEVATGRVTEACTQRHRHQEFLAFLKQVAAAYPRRELHVVVDNLSTHKHPAVRAWLERHPRMQLHFTPTSGSWLNLVEAFFSIITRQALRRGNFPTVADLVNAIERFIAAWNDRCRPFTWTKDPDTVIAKATDPRRRKTQTTSVTEH
ncbi:IS630 family transposase [Geodermatophilus obscurus]|uniref:ISMsm5, transposase n=1 Tax=Geodermatophilus obscurus (strain ATCC 25078 / DSM 43160 / JCM 3152 / CCUG 61914 / KCC A-0152 / KCTC 9177 / NBRC 13315 / NRRL B-3577 / G-20) TaxID=526225 RepID=D2SBL4_GEOOG|nr:ISMsm5, transposase [Geodermatophilus obscurus DSM 43160]